MNCILNVFMIFRAEFYKELADLKLANPDWKWKTENPPLEDNHIRPGRLRPRSKLKCKPVCICSFITFLDSGKVGSITYGVPFC